MNNDNDNPEILPDSRVASDVKIKYKDKWNRKKRKYGINHKALKRLR